MEFNQELLWIALGVFIGIIISLALPKLKDLFGSEVEEEETEEDDNLFQGDEQIKDLPNASEAYDRALFEKYPIDDLKMMLAVRTDLGMTKGKLCAQCGHGTLGSFYAAKKWASQSTYWKKIVDRWSYEGQKKVAVKAPSEADL